MEHATCPACDGRSVTPVESWPIRSTHHALACLECGLLFVFPPPTADALAAQYTQEGAYRTARPVDAEKARRKTKGSAPAMLAALDRHFRASRPAPGSRVLDFGCGKGTWLNTFQDHGWETFGIEPSTDAAFVRHERLSAIPDDPQFDLVIVYQVLEHIARPLDTLRALAGAIRPGGHCLVTVPRLDTIGVYRDPEYCLQARTHIVAFTEACLSGLLVRAGLGVIAALHDLDLAFSNGRPIKLRLLAQKGATAVVPDRPVEALRRVIEALSTVGIEGEKTRR